jgi:tetratricopeptide (TPR) repeat protein
VDDRLRPLWNFDDLDATERRFREQLELEESDAGRAQVMTQRARIAGLRGEFEEGDRLLDEATTLGRESAVAQAYVDLERGRLRRSSGDPAAALPLFESAFAEALRADQHFVAVDAAHMAALAAADRQGFLAWTQRGISLAEEREGASYWLGPLLNNLGWEYYEAADYALALDAFERALRARERDPANASAIEIARYAVGKTLRALGRAQEAIPLLEQAVAWAEREGSPDGWFHEELAEEYAAVGRLDDAHEHARRAISLLEAQDPSFADAAQRQARLASLAEG